MTFVVVENKQKQNKTRDPRHEEMVARKQKKRQEAEVNLIWMTERAQALEQRVGFNFQKFKFEISNDNLFTSRSQDCCGNRRYKETLWNTRDSLAACASKPASSFYNIIIYGQK